MSIVLPNQLVRAVMQKYTYMSVIYTSCNNFCHLAFVCSILYRKLHLYLAENFSQLQ